MRTFFREADVWHCTFGMCHGIKALHEMKILHRDLKCANVFLGSKGEVKLGDLNVSKVAKRGLCEFFFLIMFISFFLFSTSTELLLYLYGW